MKEWYTQKELAELFGIPENRRYRIQRAVNTLRKLGVIEIKRNPDDEREVLVHRDSVDTVRKSVLADGDSATA